MMGEIQNLNSLTGSFPWQVGQLCTRCVMDESDPNILFDKGGVCSHCRKFATVWESLPPLEERQKQWAKTVEEAISRSKNRKYDCLVGLSGGVDSSYVAYVAKKAGLRVLGFHFDSGWNSELAVNNIENIVKKLNIDLYTFVCDWPEMKDVQAALFRSGVAHADAQDHAYFAATYTVMKKFNIDFYFSGKNIATEYIYPMAWGYDARDSIHLKAIHKRFGQRRLKRFPSRNVFLYYLYDKTINPRKLLRPLDYFDYNKEEVIKTLSSELAWRPYGGKHYESVLTRFFQGYYLPKRFGFDKRKAHLSSLIASGQLSREAALQEMAVSDYSDEQAREDLEFVAKKIDMSVAELEELTSSKPVSFTEYPNVYRFVKPLRSFHRFITGKRS